MQHSIDVTHVYIQSFSTGHNDNVGCIHDIFFSCMCEFMYLLFPVLGLLARDEECRHETRCQCPPTFFLLSQWYRCYGEDRSSTIGNSGLIMHKLHQLTLEKVDSIALARSTRCENVAQTHGNILTLCEDTTQRTE